MKISASGIAAAAAVAVIALSACSGKGTKAADESVDSTAVAPATEAAATAVTAAVTEVKAGTPDLGEYKGRLTVVDFNAVWCGPCRKYGPTFHAVAEKKASEAVFLSVNVDSCQEIAAEYVGAFIPQTTIIRPNGEYVSKAGQLTEEQLTAFIDSVAALN